MTNKLMSFAMSFGRMGMDFRPLISEIIDDCISKRFAARVQDAANRLAFAGKAVDNCQFHFDGNSPQYQSKQMMSCRENAVRRSRFKQCRTIEISGEISDPPLLHTSQNGGQPSAPAVLASWDDLCVYGNALIDALNELRNGLSPAQV
ncbi:unnamed protein product [Gongylonema pulchrum]|uniref:Conserved oligomeric Golgi complex subunit 8 n=1 Tax=Gongylonema pulchrum TaxID=637853 RepID=A0A3P6QTU2_9BILA|nr:unnamed protein product [Gongylonema pulchrum]